MQAISHGAASADSSPLSDTPDARWQVAIIGAGFSGTATAIHLLKAASAVASPRSLQISLIDPRPEIGAGVAYATRNSSSAADSRWSTLVQSLLSSSTIRADRLSIGIDVTADGRPLSRDGTPVDRLHYIGPWLRARDWEATAVPELRKHAAALAGSLAQRNLIESVRRNRQDMPIPRIAP